MQFVILRLQFVGDVRVVLEHRTTSSHVDDHRVNVCRVKYGGVRSGQLECRGVGPAVIMNRAAAHLRPRDHDVAAVLLQHAGRRPMRVAEHGIRHTACEQRHASPLRTEECSSSGNASM